ncbi:MAG: hypothetical protein EP329_13840 [Deltaproteobacteria bacterium]|nr:MAG: hypothetical protein EP329_13840 [Deltaproteobacteria bacterium]
MMRLRMIVPVAVLGLGLGFTACADLEEPPEVAVVEAALVPPGSGCNGLCNAVENVCPDNPSCAVIQDELVKHGCDCFEPPPTACPCWMEQGWYYDAEVKGVYCGTYDYGRLSMCAPVGKGGGDICFANYGDATEYEVDPAICAACRELFPLTIDVLNSYPDTVDVYSCTTIE